MTNEELQTATTLQNQIGALSASIIQVDNPGTVAASDILNTIRTEFDKSGSYDQTTIDSLTTLIANFRTAYSAELAARMGILDNALKSLVGTDVSQDNN